MVWVKKTHLSKSYRSLLPLGPWVADLRERMRFISDALQRFLKKLSRGPEKLQRFFCLSQKGFSSKPTAPPRNFTTRSRMSLFVGQFPLLGFCLPGGLSQRAFRRPPEVGLSFLKNVFFEPTAPPKNSTTRSRFPSLVFLSGPDPQNFGSGPTTANQWAEPQIAPIFRPSAPGAPPPTFGPTPPIGSGPTTAYLSADPLRPVTSDVVHSGYFSLTKEAARGFLLSSKGNLSFLVCSPTQLICPLCFMVRKSALMAVVSL